MGLNRHGLTAMLVLVCSGCAGPEPGQITSMELPLNSLTANLNLRIETGDPAGQNTGFPASGTGQDQQGTLVVMHGLPLSRVQGFGRVHAVLGSVIPR